MKLVVFDIDGTLTRTNHIDAECFDRAFKQIVGLSGEDADWSGCRNVTDNGITEHLFQQQHGRAPRADEVQQLHDRFIDLLQQAARQQPDSFSPVPGAATAVQRLADDRSWGVAVASGCWRASGQFKLQQSGLPLRDGPAAFAEDGAHRVDVVAAAIARARAHYSEELERVVSIGDGLWDIHVARQLRLPFIGIVGHGRSDGLHENRVSHLFGDYTDWDGFRRALDEATIPV